MEYDELVDGLLTKKSWNLTRKLQIIQHRIRDELNRFGSTPHAIEMEEQRSRLECARTIELHRAALMLTVEHDSDLPIEGLIKSAIKSQDTQMWLTLSLSNGFARNDSFDVED